MATTAEKRRENRARRLVRSEARWLQKAIFALSKAEEAREKIAELYETAPDDFTIEVSGEEKDVSELGRLLREAVEARLQEQREELRERMRVR